MNALVTGGNGFLGSAIVRLLHARGHKVSVVCRRSYEHVAPFITRAHSCDLRDAASVRRACAGMDFVIHAGSLTGIWGPSDEFRSINVEGTRNVLDACRAAGVGRLVYTSSPSVVFDSRDLCGVNESYPYPANYLAAYPQTKATAERMILEANDDELATVALRPHLIWGPRDPHLIPRIIDRAKKGRLRQVGDGSNLVDITYIDNAAEAHILAADALSPSAPCAGKAYFISQGEPVALWPWINGLLRAVGIPPVNKAISLSTAAKAGWVLETVYRLLGLPGEPLMTRFLANQLAKSHYFDVSAAKRDLGYRPTISTDEGMKRLVAWLATVS